VARYIRDTSTKSKYKKAASDLLSRLSVPFIGDYMHVRMTKAELDIYKFALDTIPVEEPRQLSMWAPGVTFGEPAKPPPPRSTKPKLKTELTEEEQEARVRAGFSRLPGDKPRDAEGRLLRERTTEIAEHTRQVERGLGKQK